MKRNTLISRVLLGIYSLVFGASGIANLVGAAAVTDSIVALGFPAYMATILGIAYVLGVVALWQPASARLKEWAFAGFTIANLGGVASHLLNGDGIGLAMPLIVLWGILMATYISDQRAGLAA